MSRAVFISAGGDPFLSLFMLYLFERWQDEVNKLYICYNTNIDHKIANYVGNRFKKNQKVKWIYIDHSLGFGEPIGKCLDVSKEDLILLLEDDGFIYEKHLVNDMFQKIEGGGCDLIGSPRFSCSSGIAEATKKKYNLDYSGLDDAGPNFWPNFFFVKRKDLLKTDLNFSGYGWKKGEYIKELDYVCEGDESGDTFVWISMQLRAMNLKILEVPQYKASPTEIEDIELKRYNWRKGYFGWIHAGSLSVGWNCFLKGQYPTPLPSDLGIQELESRIAFWDIVSAWDKSSELDDFRKEYRQGIINFVNSCQLNRGRINRKKEIYRRLMNI